MGACLSENDTNKRGNQATNKKGEVLLGDNDQKRHQKG